jgi:putative heme-binding domain-containing protein
MVYYGDRFLPPAYRGSLFVPEWGSRKIAQYPLRADGDTFRADAERILLSGEGQARPVGVAVGRGGRMFATICFMAHNDSSPIYRSELVMITRADDPDDAPFTPTDEAEATTDALFAQLQAPDWSRRYRAHVELTRRSPEVAKVATARLPATATADASTLTHLIWLAAADGAEPATRARLIALAGHADPEIRCQALRALARFGGVPADVFIAALRDASPPVRLAALSGLFDRTDQFPFDQVAAAAGEDGTFVRQTAALLLARRATAAQLAGLCESGDARRRRAGILAAGFRLTVPEWDQAPEPSTPLAGGNSPSYRVTYAGGVTEDLSKRGRTGNFRIAEWWAAHTPSEDEKLIFSLLTRRLSDPDPDLARQAALFVRLLGDRASRERVDELLGAPSRGATTGATPIANAKATGAMVLPEAFRGIDWKRGPKGDAAAGQKLFVARGCVNCHSIREGDGGGGGPSLAAAGSRFDVAYLVESVLLPNKVVAPQFRWTRARLKDGDEVTGLVTGETASEIEFLLPTGIRQTVSRSDVASSEIQERSPMPDGLIQMPAEMRDLLAFLASLK